MRPLSTTVAEASCSRCMKIENHCLLSNLPCCMPVVTVHGSAGMAKTHSSTLYASVPLMLKNSFPSDLDCWKEHRRYRLHAPAFKQDFHNQGWVQGRIARALLASQSMNLTRRQRDPDGHATIEKHMAGKSLSMNLGMLLDLHTCLPFRSHTLSRYS